MINPIVELIATVGQISNEALDSAEADIKAIYKILNMGDSND